MIVTIIVNFLALLFAITASLRENNKKYLLISFTIVFVFLALRYDFGNDYMAYYEYFKDVHGMSIYDVLKFKEYLLPNLKEPGFSLLNIVFPNFFILISFIALFTCYVYYYCINKYVQYNYVWLALFMFLFDPGIMLIQSSAIRQTIAICLFLYSLNYLFKRKLIKYALIIICASLFHKSAIVLLPVYFLATQNKWRLRMSIILFVCFLFLGIFGNVFLEQINFFTQQYFPRYNTAYLSETAPSNLNTGLGLVLFSILFLFILWSHNNDKEESYSIVISKISAIGFVLFPLGIYLPMFGRISMYFIPFLILSIPYAISQLASWQSRILVIMSLISYYLYSFITFFNNPVWIEKFSVYKAWPFLGY